MHTYTRFDLINDRNLAQFYSACCTSNLATIDFVLQKKFPINSTVRFTSTDFLGDTVLHLLVKTFAKGQHWNHRKDLDRIIQQLFSYGADVTIANAATYSAIHVAFKGWHTHPILPALLGGHGYNRPNVTDQHGLSHFHVACHFNQKNLVENFLLHGVAINSKCQKYLEPQLQNPRVCGLTGLHFASENNSLETVALLLKYKADVNAENQQGLNPLRCLSECQASFESDTVGAALLSGDYHNAYVDDIKLFKLFHACQSSDVDQLRNALEMQPNIIRASVSNDSPHWPGFTLLHFAAAFGIVSIVEYLLSYASLDDVNATNTKNLTPLHYLMDLYPDNKSSQVDKILQITKYLIHHGANLNFENCNGLTPIDCALRLAKQYKTDRFIQKFFEIIRLSELSGSTELDKLFYACLEADRDYVELLSTNGRLKILVNRTTHPTVPHSLQGFTSLHFAVAGGDEKIVEILLQNEADFCTQSSRGLSPLHLAERAYLSIFVGSNIVGSILRNHLTKRVNPVDKNGLSHLHIACRHGAYEVVQSIIESKVDLNGIITKDIQTIYDDDKLYTKGDTPLHVLAKHATWNKNIFKLLLDNGANYTLKNADGATPQHLLFTYNTFILDYIFSSSTEKLVNLVDNDGYSYLHIACNKGKPELVKELLRNEKNAINEDSNIDEETLLHAAVSSGCLEVIKILVDLGANVNAKNKYRKITPLHLALMIRSDCKQKNEIISCLLSKLDCEETKPVDESGFTFFHIAAIQNDTETMKRLLKLGLDINNTINLNSSLWPGYTALHLAVGFRCADAIKLLLDEGADFTIKTKNGISPFGFTVKDVAFKAHMYSSRNYADEELENVLPAILQCNRLSEILNMPFFHYRTIFHFYCHAIKDQKAIETMLKLGANVHCPVDFFSDQYPGYTALHFAVDSGCIETARILINHGADVNAEDAFGWTPVHRACLKSNLEILQLLVRKGAYINGRVISHEARAEYDLATPLHLCALLEKFDFVDFLLKSGADVSVTNAAGKTAYSMIQFSGSAILSTMFSHFQTLEFFNFSINDQDRRRSYYHRPAVDNSKDECEKLLKDKTYVDDYSTLSDLLTATPRKMYQLMKETKLQGILYSAEYDEKYPNSGFILKLQYQKGLEYQELLRNTMYSINPFVEHYLPLPELCIEKILENLDGYDLNKLVEISNSIILNRTWFQ